MTIPSLATSTRAGSSAGPVDNGDEKAHVLRGVLWGSTAAVVAYVVVASGILPGPVCLAAAVAVLLLLPTAPDLARRISVNVCAAIGWVPVLWWVRWPVPVDHAALVVAGGLGALAGMVTASNDPGRRARGLAPRVSPGDCLIVVGAAAALTALWRWASPSSPHGALVALLPGADNYAHFHMFSTIRAHGAVTTAAGASPDGSGWGFDEYPQGFHALAATISELMYPHLAPGPQMLVAYTQAVAAVVVLGVVAMTATIVSLPGLRGRPMLAVPLVVVTWTAFLWQPGQDLLADGFANFWLAAAAVPCALLLSLGSGERLRYPEVVAVAGLLVAVAHGWAPLVVIAAPAALAVLHPFRSTLLDRDVRRRLWVCLAILLVASLGVLKALLGLFAKVEVKAVVTASGGIHGTDPTPTFLLILAAFFLCASGPSVVRRWGASDEQVVVAGRLRLLLLAPLAGLLLSVALIVSQLRTVGTSAYYFLKFFMGFELALAAFVPAVLGLLLASLPPVVSSRRAWVRVLVVVLTAALASQAFGRFPHRPVPLMDAGRDGTASVGAPYSAPLIARGILAAVGSTTSAESFSADYLAVGPGRAKEAFYPDGWYHGILASLSARNRERLDILRTGVDGLDDAVRVAQRLLTQDSDMVLVVSPKYAGSLRARLGAPLGDRVTSWSAGDLVETQGER